jgi:hypothetical protein
MLGWCCRQQQYFGQLQANFTTLAVLNHPRQQAEYSVYDTSIAAVGQIEESGAFNVHSFNIKCIPLSHAPLPRCCCRCITPAGVHNPKRDMAGGANAAFLGYVDTRGCPWLFVVALKGIAEGEVSQCCCCAAFTMSVVHQSSIAKCLDRGALAVCGGTQGHCRGGGAAVVRLGCLLDVHPSFTHCV